MNLSAPPSELNEIIYYIKYYTVIYKQEMLL